MTDDELLLIDEVVGRLRDGLPLDDVAMDLDPSLLEVAVELVGDLSEVGQFAAQSTPAGFDAVWQGVSLLGGVGASGAIAAGAAGAAGAGAAGGVGAGAAGGVGAGAAGGVGAGAAGGLGAGAAGLGVGAAGAASGAGGVLGSVLGVIGGAGGVAAAAAVGAVVVAAVALGSPGPTGDEVALSDPPSASSAEDDSPDVPDPQAAPDTGDALEDRDGITSPERDGQPMPSPETDVVASPETPTQRPAPTPEAPMRPAPPAPADEPASTPLPSPPPRDAPPSAPVDPPADDPPADDPPADDPPSVPVERPSVPVERPSVPVERPLVPVERPLVPVERPSDGPPSGDTPEPPDRDADTPSADRQLEVVSLGLPDANPILRFSFTERRDPDTASFPDLAGGKLDRRGPNSWRWLGPPGTTSYPATLVVHVRNHDGSRSELRVTITRERGGSGGGQLRL